MCPPKQLLDSLILSFMVYSLFLVLHRTMSDCLSMDYFASPMASTRVSEFPEIQQQHHLPMRASTYSCEAYVRSLVDGYDSSSDHDPRPSNCLHFLSAIALSPTTLSSACMTKPPWLLWLRLSTVPRGITSPRNKTVVFECFQPFRTAIMSR